MSSRLLKITENFRKRLKWNPSEVQTKEKEAISLLRRAPRKREHLLCLQQDFPEPFHQPSLKKVGLSCSEGHSCA